MPSQPAPPAATRRTALVAPSAVLLAAALAGFAAGPAAAAGAAAPVVAPAAAELNRVVEGWYEEMLALNPVAATFVGDYRHDDRLGNPASDAYHAATDALDRRYLAELAKIDPATLRGQDRLTYDVFRYQRELDVAGRRFQDELLPVEQMSSLPALLAMLGSGASAQRFTTPAEYDAWARRAAEFPAWVDSAIAQMRKGLARGVTHPRAAVEMVVPQLEALAKGPPEESVFWGPIRGLPESFPAAERERLTREYRALIGGTLLPAYARLRDFMTKEYVPGARATAGWAALPDGTAWYAHAARVQTTLDASPADIHEIGLAEVARIRAEMEAVRKQVGFEGDLEAFFTFLETDPRFYYDRPEDLLDGYRAIKGRVDAALPKLFRTFPKADYEIRAVEPFRAESAAGASYQRPSPDGKRPGIFYVNTFNLKAQPKFGMETLSLHEASPGHHFQVAIAQELEGLPRFRRFGGNVAYGEGWALYAESIGRELGLFQDPYQYYGRLSDEMLRAMRLVVDTGLHAKGWSREQAIRYMLENSTMAESDVVSEVERYMVWPGQALGYKLGQLRITAMRAKAERELGPKFDVRTFHDEVLRDGPLPILVLEAKIDRWIAAQR